MKVFYTPSANGCYPVIIDTLVEIEGSYIGQFSRETLEQVARRHPTVMIGDALEVAEQREAMMISEPVQITEEQFIEALECLPPEGWVRNQHTESFKMCEYYSGRITSIYARFADTYWTFKDIGSKTHVEIMDKVGKVAVAFIDQRRQEKAAKVEITPMKLAAAFSRALGQYLTADQISEVAARNEAETDAGICHSHDFCDANQAMLDALETLGQEFDPSSEDQTNLMNTAWDMAKAVKFDTTILDGKKLVWATP